MLEKAGVKKLKTPGYYGLALALGGAEVSAQDLAALYAMLGNGGKFRPLRWRKDEPQLPETAMLSPEAAFLTLDMLSYNAPVDRRRLPFAKRSGTPYKVYWKTGTSYGYKDAWAAGLFGDFVLVVWVGNFDGTPNPAFTGREAAAPLFFRLVRQIAAGAELPETAFALTGLTCRRLIFAPQPEIWPMPIVLKRLNHILFPVLPGLNCPGSAAGFRLKLPAGCVPADIRRRPPGWKPMISGPRMCCRLLPVPA